MGTSGYNSRSFSMAALAEAAASAEAERRRQEEIARLLAEIAKLEKERQQYYEARKHTIESIESCDRLGTLLATASTYLSNSFSIGEKPADGGRIGTTYEDVVATRSSLVNNTLAGIDGKISSLDSQINARINSLSGNSYTYKDDKKQISFDSPATSKAADLYAGGSGIIHFDEELYNQTFISTMISAQNEFDVLSNSLGKITSSLPAGFPNAGTLKYTTKATSESYGSISSIVDFVNKKIERMVSIEKGAREKAFSLSSLGVDTSKMTKSQIDLVNQCMSTWPSEMSSGRIAVILDALSLLGSTTTYSQPGRTKGYDSDMPNHLDCSSFVSWCYNKAGMEIRKDSYTGTYVSGVYEKNGPSFLNKINSTDKNPGDIALANEGTAGGYSNHTGIFLGYDANGKEVFIDMSNRNGGKVDVSYNLAGTKIYRRYIGIDNFETTTKLKSINETLAAREETLKLLQNTFGESNVKLNPDYGPYGGGGVYEVTATGVGPDGEPYQKHMFVPLDSSSATDVISYIPGSAGSGADQDHLEWILQASPGSIVTLATACSDKGHSMIMGGEFLTAMNQDVEHLTSINYSAAASVGFERTIEFLNKYPNASADVLIIEGNEGIKNNINQYETSKYVDALNGRDVNVILATRENNVDETQTLASTIATSTDTNTYVIVSHENVNKQYGVDHSDVPDSLLRDGISALLSDDLDNAKDFDSYDYYELSKYDKTNGGFVKSSFAELDTQLQVQKNKNRVDYSNPSSPVLVNPEPSAPVNPESITPVNPAPVTPVNPESITPVNPAPVTPVNPEPTNPVNPAPITPVNPEPTNPVNPAPITPVNPAPTNPVNPVNPEPTKPVEENPIDVKPIEDKPIEDKPIINKPIEDKPSMPEPSKPSKPSIPGQSKPSKPSIPNAYKPPVDKPVVEDPIIENPIIEPPHEEVPIIEIPDDIPVIEDPVIDLPKSEYKPSSNSQDVAKTIGVLTGVGAAVGAAAYGAYKYTKSKEEPENKTYDEEEDY